MHCSWECFGFVSVMTSPCFCADLSNGRRSSCHLQLQLRKRGKKRGRAVAQNKSSSFLQPAIKPFSLIAALYLSSKHISKATALRCKFRILNCSILNWPGKLHARQLIKCTQTSPFSAERGPTFAWLNSLTMQWKENYKMKKGEGVGKGGRICFVFFSSFFFFLLKQKKTGERGRN